MVEEDRSIILTFTNEDMRTPADEIVLAIKSVIADGSRELQRPIVTVKDIYCPYDPLGCWAIEKFEAKLCAIANVEHAIAVSSGTAALHVALMAVGVKPGDEVIIPALTFAATANAVCHCGATPHFVDVRASNLGINAFKLRQYLAAMTASARRRIKAIVPVHLLGLPCDIEGVMEVATDHGIAVIEDAAEALGTGLLGTNTQVGHSGRGGIFSFNINKIVTTGGGGAVITDDGVIAGRVRHLSTTSKMAHPFLWVHDAIGWNYRMPNLCAAFGASQLERLVETIYAKRRLASRYAAAFAESEVAHLIVDNRSNCWLNAIIISPRYPGIRDEVIRGLLADGYEARAIFTPLHLLPHFSHCPRQQNLMVAEDLFNRVVCLPSSIGSER